MNVVVETSCIRNQKIPDRFTRRASKDGDESADDVIYSNDHDDDPGSISQKAIHGFRSS
jgi:hypothetical protein